MHEQHLKELPTSNNKITTDILNFLTPEKMKLQHHSDGSVELVTTKAFDNQLEYASKVASALNHYITSNNITVKDTFEARKMVRGDELYIKIFSPEIGVDKELISLLSMVSIEFITNAFESITTDIGYNSPENLSELESSMACLVQHSEEILAVNKKLGLNVSLLVEGPATEGAIALKGTLKPPAEISYRDPQDYQNLYYKIVASDTSDSSVKAVPYLFGNKNNLGKAETLYYEDKIIVDVLRQYYFDHRDYKLNISEKKRPDDKGLMKVITSIEPTEVPLGSNKNTKANEDQREITFPV